MRREKIGDGGNDFRVGEHSRLRRGNGKKARDLLRLFAHERGRNGMDAGNAARILRRERGNRRRPENAVRGERQQIRLNARAAAGIRAGDGERDGQVPRCRSRGNARPKRAAAVFFSAVHFQFKSRPSTRVRPSAN